MRRLREEAIQLFDNSDRRTFDEIYKDKMDLFEDVDDIIDPRMKKLFEATYQTGNVQQKRLREEFEDEPSEEELEECGLKYGAANGYKELDNRNDGVPDGHNRPGIGGSNPQVRQSTPRYHTNKPLNEDERESEEDADVNEPMNESHINLFNRIFENSIPEGGHYDSGKGSPKPRGDGVPDGHNSSEMGGSSPAVRQSKPRYHTNKKLGSEPSHGYGTGPRSKNRG
jgi:hypothetical protein